MKKIYLSFLLILNIYTIQAQIVNIPDANFKNALLNNYPVIDTNGDGEIQFSEVQYITFLDVSWNSINDMTGIGAFTNLQSLVITSNPISNIDLSSNLSLTSFNANNCQLTSLDLSNNQNIQTLYVSDNQISNLNVNGLLYLYDLYANNNQINNLNLSSNVGLEMIEVSENQLTALDLSTNVNLDTVIANNNQLTNININGATNLYYLSINNNQFTNFNIAYFTPLLELDISDNQINLIDISGAVNLLNLNVNNNSISIIDLTSLSDLTSLRVEDNQLTSLDVNSNSDLYYLYGKNNQITNVNLNLAYTLNWVDLNNNQITDINLSGNSNLNRLLLSNNQITSLDLSTVPSLQELDISYNHLTSLSGFELVPNLGYLDCSHNQLTSLDFSGLQPNFPNTSFGDLTFDFNDNLEYINFKNGNNDDFGLYTFHDNLWNLNNLQAVCLDDVNSTFAYYVQVDSPQDIVITEYCSFTPGGDFYEVQGQVSIDLDNNGCDVGDEIYPNLNIQIDNGSEVDSFYSSDSGIYYMPIQSGNYTITPQLENPVYFSVNPISNIVNFPSDVSPSSQDYCITPNGNYNDLEVVIVPLEAARPGFDTDYKIVFKNKGTTTLSGILNLTYDDNHMDLVTVNPIADSQSTGVLSFNYNLLLPFETREITFTMNLNTPTDVSYPLLGDDVLNFLATITPVDSDETPLDNTFALDQIVVNSYDPNDKTCLEGETIDISRVGEFIHYLIRFENTGTANAVNIVVKDVIDASKYDISSLVPLDASHNFYTRIRNGNEVEFIFENIQLPYDDANNDGHVLFKIKTESSLVVGDTFTNQAEIYFDFNAPIITNNEITTVVEDNLSVQSYDLINKIKVFPNPTDNNIFIEAIEGVEIYTIEVIDISGKELLRLKNVNNCNLLGLTSGIYFLKIQTNKGKVNKKIIKK